MKRYNNLFEKVCSMENLELADMNARKGKKKKWGVVIHDRHREENLKNLQRQLLNGTFKTSEYHTMVVHEPKERLIYKLPYYPDRIVHHAIMNVLEPIWVGSMTADTYANIKGRGIHACSENLKHVLYIDPKGTRYCLKVDIRKYYPSIDHELLKKEVRRKIKDARLLALIDEIIDSEKGLPIGNYLSQYLANVYLSNLDHRMKEVHRAPYYFPIRGRHGVPRGNKRGVEKVAFGVREGSFGIGTSSEGQLADIPSGCERDRLSRVPFLSRSHARKEAHKAKDFQEAWAVEERGYNIGDVREVHGFLGRMAHVGRLTQTA